MPQKNRILFTAARSSLNSAFIVGIYGVSSILLELPFQIRKHIDSANIDYAILCLSYSSIDSARPLRSLIKCISNFSKQNYGFLKLNSSMLVNKTFMRFVRQPVLVVIK